VRQYQSNDVIAFDGRSRQTQANGSQLARVSLSPDRDKIQSQRNETTFNGIFLLVSVFLRRIPCSNKSMAEKGHINTDRVNVTVAKLSDCAAIK